MEHWGRGPRAPPSLPPSRPPEPPLAGGGGGGGSSSLPPLPPRTQDGNSVGNAGGGLLRGATAGEGGATEGGVGPRPARVEGP